MEEAINICIIADDPLARAGLASLLATLPQVAIVLQGSSDLLPDLTAGEGDVDVDIIIWDMGWEADLHEGEESLGRAIPTIILIQDDEQAAEAWSMGPRGLLFRGIDLAQLPPAIDAVAAGLIVIAPGLTQPARPSSPSFGGELSTELTPREREVLYLLAEGLTNKAIARRLSISDHTVKFHVNAIMGKLDAQSRTDAVVRATRLGLISL